MDDFIYWRHTLPPGIKIEEISGGSRYSGEVWKQMALQIYCEHGKEQYREIGHFPNGAPFLYGDASRISISHCKGLLVVATLPPTPECDLSQYHPRTSMGVDCERADRAQVLKIRQRFLNDAEMEMIPADDVEANIIAWTAKEAAYKALFTPGLDFRNEIVIEQMPEIGGFGTMAFNGERCVKLQIYTYRSDEHIVTLCYELGIKD